MSARSLLFTFFFFLFLLQETTVFAQQKEDTLHTNREDTLFKKGREDTLVAETKNTDTAVVLKKEDTVIVTSKVADNSGKGLLASDSSIEKRFNPRKATLRSLILPGWGQYYNKKYWKIPIVYGALGITGGVFFYNLKTYKLLRQAVIYLSDKDTSNDRLIAPEFNGFSIGFLRENRNVFRQNIDYSVMFFLLIWGLNIVDASVDAHLKAFDVSPDISMRIQPGLDNITNAPGISFVFSFKEKSSRPLLPLP
ncbi:MAG: DUF5683 domain-containing protein [Ginsengibacter sp.]